MQRRTISYTPNSLPKDSCNWPKVGFGTESVDVGGQPVEAVVFEGFVTAVGIVGTDRVARCVVVVAGGMAQRIGNGFEISVFGVSETGGFAGTVGKADELVEGVVVNC